MNKENIGLNKPDDFRLNIDDQTIAELKDLYQMGMLSLQELPDDLKQGVIDYQLK